MDWQSVLELGTAALGGGGVFSLINWRLSKRKQAAVVKQEEIEVIRKEVEDAYKPTITFLKDQVKELQEEVKGLQEEIKSLRQERDECHTSVAKLMARLDTLDTGRPARDPSTGRFYKKNPDGNYKR